MKIIDPKFFSFGFFSYICNIKNKLKLKKMKNQAIKDVLEFKQKIKNILEEDHDITNPAYQSRIKKTYADLYEMQIAKRLNHTYTNDESSDGTSPSGKKIEYKTIMVCNTTNLTISNLNNKEDVILYIANDVIDENEHWFYFPKFEINNVYGISRYEWAILNEEEKDNIETFGKFFDNHLSRGKATPPKDYNSDESYTWRKGYLRARKFTIEEIKMLSIFSDEQVREYLSYEHNGTEKDLLDIE